MIFHEKILYLTYLNRCVYRKPPKNAGDNVFLPESFPPTGEPDVPEGPVELPNLRDEDREEVCVLSLQTSSQVLALMI